LKIIIFRHDTQGAGSNFGSNLLGFPVGSGRGQGLGLRTLGGRVRQRFNGSSDVVKARLSVDTDR
jgi:hypothetical protein